MVVVGGHSRCRVVDLLKVDKAKTRQRENATTRQSSARMRNSTTVPPRERVNGLHYVLNSRLRYLL